MKLYYLPGACSLSPHIVMREADLKFSLERVDLKTRQTESGIDFRTINSKGSIPALQLDDGRVLTEGAAIVQYLADLVPDRRLAPPGGSFERYQLMEALNYIASEMHKAFSPIFRPNTPEEWKAGTLQDLRARLDWMSNFMEGKTFVVGDHFTVADAYLYTVLRWTGHVGIDLAKWPTLLAYEARIGRRPKVQEALRAEGL